MPPARALTVAQPPHKLAVLTPGPPPHAPLPERPIAQVREPRQELQHIVLVRDWAALIVVHQPFVTGKAGVHVESEALAILKAKGLLEAQLDELERGGWDGLVEDALLRATAGEQRAEAGRGFAADRNARWSQQVRVSRVRQ